MYDHQARLIMRDVERALAKQDSSVQIATANELARLLRGYVQETRQSREAKRVSKAIDALLARG